MDALSRRAVCLGALALGATTARADDRHEYVEYPFDDFFAHLRRGTSTTRKPDIDKAIAIADSMPTDNPYHVMTKLSQINIVGSTGEEFNRRWKTVANPLIVLFFHDIGYRRTPMLGDCTPWCAATLAWCLKRSGRPIPAEPASSQSFLRYGSKVTSPRIGDICVFTDVGNSSNGHVGFFVSEKDGVLQVLGGNQSGESMTNCGVGFRQSHIGLAEIPINPRRDPKAGIHYLAEYVRPV